MVTSTVAAMERTCPSCGATITDADALHCHRCGARLETVAVGDPPQIPAERRNWAVAAHLSAFVGAITALAFLGPLVVWLFKRHEDPFVEAHAREALNFNLTLLIWLAIGAVLALVVIGFFILAAVGIAWIVLTVVAAVRASNGEAYRYPMTIRFVS